MACCSAVLFRCLPAPSRILLRRFSRSAPNVITLSCKSRPPRRPHLGGAAAAATNVQRRERTAADVTPACSSEPPGGGSAAEPWLGGFCQLVRAVSRPWHAAGWRLEVRAPPPLWPLEAKKCTR